MNPESQRNEIFRGKGNEFMLKEKTFFFFLRDYERSDFLQFILIVSISEEEVRKQETTYSCLIFYIHRLAYDLR